MFRRYVARHMSRLVFYKLKIILEGKWKLYPCNNLHTNIVNAMFTCYFVALPHAVVILQL